MKEILIIVIIVLFSSSIQILSHDSDKKPIHQRIVQEAYKLLKLQFSKPNGFGWFDDYLWPVINGSADEDKYDPVEEQSGVLATLTHFWHADGVNFEAEVNFGFPIGRYKNAYFK